MRLLIFTVLTLLCLSQPVATASAETTNQGWGQYQPITNLGSFGGGEGDNLSAGEFVKLLYGISISVAALLAVIKITYGGVQYMLTDVVTYKEQAKKDIWGALFGLVIVISAVLLLNIINPRLTTLNIFTDIEPVNDGSQSNSNSDVQPVSQAQSDQRVIDQRVAQDIAAGEYSALRKKYDFGDTPMADRQNLIDNIWTEDCEVDSTTGAETGYELREISGGTTGTWACVRP